MKGKSSSRLERILNLEALDFREALDLYLNEDITTLMWLGNAVRKKRFPEGRVGWIIDRNINITNVCSSRCSFCNFHRIKTSEEAYITSMDEYREKIRELFAAGGNQILLQGGLHPDLGLDFYRTLFKDLKDEFPELKLHALGPPEIHDLAIKEGITYREVLYELRRSGLDSLPGAGAEILCDEVRSRISAGKANTEEWLEVMREAHRLNLPTSATMMYGHIESPEQRMEHLFRIREVQSEKPEGAYGFITFVPWPFQAENTRLKKRYPGNYKQPASEYIRMIALSRIVLNNVDHIQASWLTVGPEVAKVCLHSGADDLGSVMMEENVVSSAGAFFRMNPEEMQKAIRDAGFMPRFRNQKYDSEEFSGLA